MEALQRIDEEGVTILRLNRPAQRNAMNSGLLEAMLAQLAGITASSDGATRVLVFSTTSETALSAGADVSEVLDETGGVRRMTLFTRLYSAVEAFPLPTIAVCVGNVVGAGAELAAGCDLRVGGHNLKLAWAGARHGVPVGPARLVPLIGLSRAKDLIYTGRVVGAEEAERIGLTHRTAPAGQAEAVAFELARTLAQARPEGLRRLKLMFGELGGGAARVELENDLLNEFQRTGPGLPSAPANR